MITNFVIQKNIINIFLKICLLINSFCFAQETNKLFYAGDKTFTVISTSYNNADWYKKSLDSLFNQTYTNWRLVYIDDASPDDTGSLVEKYISKRGFTHKTELIKNTVRLDKLANLYRVIHELRPCDIVVMLDGDDWFYDNTVLEYLNSVYQDPNIWLTYGTYQVWPSKAMGPGRLPHWVLDQQRARYYEFTTSHLKTFYAGLFHKIKQQDLMFNGAFITMIDDVAFMTPMVEMAGFHSHYIAKILYVFNQENSVRHIDRNFTIQATYDYVACRLCYSKLKELM